MLILIIVLMIVLIVLFAQFGSNYYTQVRVIRRFFKNKGTTPDAYLEHSTVLRDAAYESVLPNGTYDIYTANDATELQPLVVWVHGGGYVGGDKSCAEPWARVLATELHVAVVSINYCLAPEQHYPGPLLQLDEAIRYLGKNAERLRLDMQRIFIAGDSAGAQITSQYAALVSSEALQTSMRIYPYVQREQLRGIVLCCGFYNMDTVMHARFPAMKTFLWAYTNEKKIKRFVRKDEMSAVRQITRSYCDVFLTCGDADPFRGQATELTQALTAADIPHEAYLPKVAGKKLGHEYQFLIGTTEADTALHKAVNFIETRL